MVRNFLERGLGMFFLILNFFWPISGRKIKIRPILLMQIRKKIFQNRFFSIFEKMLEMLSKHHIYVKKCFLMVLGPFFSHNSMYIVILCNFLKIDIFAKNHDFDEFWDFLIFHDLADWPAGNGRNYD